MWYSENIGVIATAKPFKYEGISYPATTFKHSELLGGLSIYPLIIERPDPRYYTQGAMTMAFADGVWTQSYEAIPKDFDDLQMELVRYYLNYLDTTLSRSDKFLTRSDEMSNWFSKWAISPALQQWRDGVYLLFNTRMNSIANPFTKNKNIKHHSKRPFGEDGMHFC